ncbi:MAG: ABC transporter substrate-binding protein [Nitrospirae bacterium]|nr:ABC transporter substrate-binding protein [Nitrospirota bacterium]MBF0592261.1 ABC transporter substrate-binding protein [Nitrospirota bacterium]
MLLLWWWLVLLLCGCVDRTERLEGYLYCRIGANPTTLDPAYVVDVLGGMIAAKLYNGLVRLDDDLQVAPDIARQWRVSDDGLTYTFVLREDVVFHNDKRLTADDVVYSFRRIMSPQTHSPNAWMFKNVADVKVAQTGTIEITLKRPFAPFLKLLTMPAAYIVSEAEVERFGKDFGLHPVGTGPFALSRWEPDNDVVLKKNGLYFDPPAKINGIVYRIIPEDITSVTEFLTGNLDILGVPASAYAMFAKDAHYAGLIAHSSGLNTFYLGLNNSRGPLDNPNLRKAIACAIDRRKILQRYLQGQGRYATSAVPSVLSAAAPYGGLKGYAVADYYPYDPDRALAFLRASGIAGSVKLRFYVSAIQESIDIAEIIAYYLRQVGIGVEIRILEWSAYKVAINNGEPDMFWLSWWADYPDAENFLYPMFHSSNLGAGGNRIRYINPQVDALIEQARRTLADSEREAIYKRVEDAVVTDAAAVFFWHRNDYIVRQPWIRGLHLYPIYNMDKATGIEKVKR